MATGRNGASGATLIVGGTRGIGRRLAEQYAGRGRRVVITGRDASAFGDIGPCRGQADATAAAGDVYGLFGVAIHGATPV